MTDPGDTHQVSFNWSPKNLEIKTRTVERTLEPLVMQVKMLLRLNSFNSRYFCPGHNTCQLKAPDE